MKGLFITATGTGIGKTFFSCALALALRERGRKVAAIKPIETGAHPEAQDALALAGACGRPELATAQGLFRAAPPLAPYAVVKEGGPSVGSLPVLCRRVRDLAAGSDVALVEGAGGVLVPIDARNTMAELALELDFPAILVAQDALGVLSYTLTAVEALHTRGVTLHAIVLNRSSSSEDDPSPQSNQAVLADYLPGTPIHRIASADAPETLVPAIRPLIDTWKL